MWGPWHAEASKHVGALDVEVANSVGPLSSVWSC